MNVILPLAALWLMCSVLMAAAVHDRLGATRSPWRVRHLAVVAGGPLTLAGLGLWVLFWLAPRWAWDAARRGW